MKHLSWFVIVTLLSSYILPIGGAFAAPKSEKEKSSAAERSAKPERGKPEEPAGKNNKAKKGTPVKAGQPKKPIMAAKGPAKKATSTSKSKVHMVTKNKPPVNQEPVSLWVDLNSSHVGTSSEGPAVWHFVLVGLGKGASPGVVTVIFQKAGTFVLDPYSVNQQMQHFKVTLSAADTLLAGYANVMLPELKTGVKLNLSSVTCTAPPSEEETDKLKPPKPPVEPKPKPTPKPVVNKTLVVQEESSDDSDELPSTGGNAELLIGLSIGSSAVGSYLRKRAKGM